MRSDQILSRRNVGPKEKTDFRPDNPDGNSPFAQLRRLSHVLDQNSAPAEDFNDMDDALNAWREYTYRKVFSGTTHDEFMKLDQDDPQRLDWLLAVAAIDAEHFKSSKEKEKSNATYRRTPQ